MDKNIKYIPLGLLFAFSLKSLALGFTWESIVASAIFSGLYAFLENKAENKKVAALKTQLDNLTALIYCNKILLFNIDQT